MKVKITEVNKKQMQKDLEEQIEANIIALKFTQSCIAHNYLCIGAVEKYQEQKEAIVSFDRIEFKNTDGLEFFHYVSRRMQNILRNNNFMEMEINEEVLYDLYDLLEKSTKIVQYMEEQKTPLKLLQQIILSIINTKYVADNLTETQKKELEINNKLIEHYTDYTSQSTGLEAIIR